MKTRAHISLMVLGIGLLLSVSAMQSYALTEGDYTYTVESGNATITAFPKNYAGALTMPAVLGGCPVAAIGNNSFKSCTNLTAVTIPGTVTNVGEFAFWRCGKLASVSLPDSLTVLGLAAFCACPSLKGVTIPCRSLRLQHHRHRQNGRERRRQVLGLPKVSSLYRFYQVSKRTGNIRSRRPRSL